MTARESARLSYIRYEDITAQVARQILLRALFLKNRKSAGPNGLALDKPTIASTEMRHDCERDLIDKERGSLFGTFESRKKSGSQMRDDGIDDARRAVEIGNRRPAGFVSKPIEDGSWNIERQRLVRAGHI